MKQLNNIRHCREYKGYSQKYVATQLGKSQAAYSKIESGSTHLSDETIEKLRKILEVPKEILFSDTEVTMDHSKDNARSPSLNENTFCKTNNDLLHSLIDLVNNLFSNVSENKKSLQQLRSNQKKMQQQLNVIMAGKIKNSSLKNL